MAFDPYGDLDSFWIASNTTSPIQSTHGEDGFNWESFIPNILKLTPSIISASKGNPYQSTPYGPAGGYGYAGAGTGGLIGGQGTFLGSSGGFSISPMTLLLIAGGALLFMNMKGGRR